MYIDWVHILQGTAERLFLQVVFKELAHILYSNISFTIIHQHFETLILSYDIIILNNRSDLEIYFQCKHRYNS